MNPFARLLAAVVLFLTAGCAGRPGDTYNVIVDHAARVDFVEVVATAAANWEMNVPVHLKVMWADGCHAGDGVICVHQVPQSDVDSHTGTNRGDRGVTRPAIGPWGLQDGGDTWVRDTLQGSELLWVVTHELGHSQGLEHTTGNAAVMCVVHGCHSDEITAVDVQQWHDVRR